MALDKKDHDALYNGYSYSMETLADYKHGGYHPVNMNDCVGENDRYELIRKLAHGPCSTVWLARDKPEKKYVAVKIMGAKVSRKADKTSILDDAQNATKGAEFAVQEFERFKFKGPNGNHIVSIQEVMGPDLAMFWHCVNDKRVAKKMDKLKLPMAKSIIRQTLQGVQALHQSNIAHGNITTSNVALQLEGLNEIDHTYLEINFGPKDDDKFMEAPKKQKGVPDVVYASMPITRAVKLDDDGIHVKLLDMNGAFTKDIPQSEFATFDVHNAAPELVLGANPDIQADIWSLGCFIFEMVTTRKMFEFTKQKVKEQEDELLFEMNAIIGELPDDLVSKWKPSKAFASNVKDGKVDPPNEYKHSPNLEHHFDNWKPDMMKANEAKQVKELLRSIFQYDVSKRPTVTDLINNEWISSA